MTCSTLKLFERHWNIPYSWNQVVRSVPGRLDIIKRLPKKRSRTPADHLRNLEHYLRIKDLLKEVQKIVGTLTILLSEYLFDYEMQLSCRGCEQKHFVQWRWHHVVEISRLNKWLRPSSRRCLSEESILHSKHGSKYWIIVSCKHPQQQNKKPTSQHTPWNIDSWWISRQWVGKLFARMQEFYALYSNPCSCSVLSCLYNRFSVLIFTYEWWSPKLFSLDRSCITRTRAQTSRFKDSLPASPLCVANVTRGTYISLAILSKISLLDRAEQLEVIEDPTIQPNVSDSRSILGNLPKAILLYSEILDGTKRK